MERYDFEAFGQVVAVAIEQGIRAGLEAHRPPAKDERSERIHNMARRVVRTWRAGVSHETLKMACSELADALESK